MCTLAISKSSCYMRYLSIFLILICWSCSNKQSQTTQEETQSIKPKNIILLIGDGTGLSQISASQFYNDTVSNYDQFKHIGLIKTSSSNSLITDSAAGATAFASGIKTYNGAIGVDTDTIAQPTILEQLAQKGYATGVIATSSITHATPASFYAHVPYRRMEDDIAIALAESPVQFFAGGGINFFSTEKRKDQKDILGMLTQKTFQVDTTALPNPQTILDPTKKYGYLLANGGMPKVLEGRGSFLTDATQLGIQHLSQDGDGFFLMVEGSQVDWGGHANDTDFLISELIDFDDAIGAALAFAKSDKETLVIVTADHETGGFSLSSDKGDYNTLKPSFSTGGHTATMVPVFAYGPGSERFQGIYENNLIYNKMAALLLD